MPTLKLTKLPDRTPIKLTITITPDLNQLLTDYAEAYRDAYGQSEQVADLIPYMLRSFLESDRGFSRGKAKS
ncbi:hypothetical protein J2Y54_001172 [Sphingomonas sp. BE123]|jgi:hypothetical protein|uniref:DUF2274 domain-containing protein n=1 Tax=Sphingomonas sp. BE123 TaxID=2817842 RepID=UPI002864A423|nr:DUF2274 domain-containing protein [Sphingomonas sp. BE123]MDR6851679.1 hypothetical protein [Sphingomonas sp. BE123]